jgi:molecular chaperone GrpE
MQDMEKQENPSVQQDNQALTPLRHCRRQAARCRRRAHAGRQAGRSRSQGCRDAGRLPAPAEGENIRRRPGRHRQGPQVRRRRLRRSLLPVKDSLEMALKIENASLESLKEGVDMT